MQFYDLELQILRYSDTNIWFIKNNKQMFRFRLFPKRKIECNIDREIYIIIMETFLRKNTLRSQPHEKAANSNFKLTFDRDFAWGHLFDSQIAGLQMDIHRIENEKV